MTILMPGHAGGKEGLAVVEEGRLSPFVRLVTGVDVISTTSAM